MICVFIDFLELLFILKISNNENDEIQEFIIKKFSQKFSKIGGFGRELGNMLKIICCSL